MTPPFTPEQFLAVFETYNLAVWPMQVFFYLLAVLALVMAIRKRSYTDWAVSAILAFMWFWNGIVYHLIFFTAINPAASLFGMLFILQGLLFLYGGVLRTRLSFRFRGTAVNVVGAVFMLYALIIYPLWGYALENGWVTIPTLGLPCPTTIFTFALLLWTAPKMPKYLLFVPLLWSLIGFSAALQLGIIQDYGLPVAGVVGTLLIYLRDHRVEERVTV